MTFRALIEGPGENIEFTTAALVAGDLFRRPAVARAFEDLAAYARTAIGYEAVGHVPLRAAIADHLTRRWRLPTTQDEVIVTTGAQQAIGLATALYARPGEVVAVEDPTYLTAIDVFTAAGVRLLPVPIGVQGVRPERLRDAILEASPRFAYLMPTYQNPTGVVMPERERRETAYLAQELQVPIVEDLTVADLFLDEPPPPPIGAFQGEVPVLTIGSLSKVLWGGLRVGWIRAPAPVDPAARADEARDRPRELDGEPDRRRAPARGPRRDPRGTAGPRARAQGAARVAAPRAAALVDVGAAGRRAVPVGPRPGRGRHVAVAGRVPSRRHDRPRSDDVGRRQLRRPGADAVRARPDEMRDGVDRLAAAWAEYEPTIGSTPRAVRVVV